MADRNNRRKIIKVKSTRSSANKSNNNKKKLIKQSKKLDKASSKNNKKPEAAKIYSLENERRLRSSNARQSITFKNKKDAQKVTNIKSVRKASKKEKRNTALYANVLATAIFIVVIVYFSVFFAKYFNRGKVHYNVIEMGIIDSPKTAQGIIIRDEKVYQANRNGVISFNVSNNDRVKEKTAIATIRNEEVLKDMEQELNDINQEILSLQESRAELSLFSKDVENINEQIQNIIDENIAYFLENDTSKIYEISDTVQKKIDMRNQMILSESTGSLSELATKKQAQEEKISANSGTIRNEESGIFSYYIDGLENELTKESMLTLTKEQTKMDNRSSLETSASKLQVLQEEDVFKIVRNNMWYIVSYLDSSFVEGFEVGQTKNIYIKNARETKELEAKVYHIEKDPKETFIIFEMTKNMLDYIDTRSVTFELNKVKPGFKINNESIAEENFLKIPVDFVAEESYVIKQTSSGNINVSIDLSYSEDATEFAQTPIQAGILNVGDVILNPNDLTKTYTISEIFTAKGVYVINTGISKFKKINLENSVSNEQYTVLDPSLNSNIKIYDRTISDVKNVTSSKNVYKQ